MFLFTAFFLLGSFGGGTIDLNAFKRKCKNWSPFNSSPTTITTTNTTTTITPYYSKYDSNIWWFLERHFSLQAQHLGTLESTPLHLQLLRSIWKSQPRQGVGKLRGAHGITTVTVKALEDPVEVIQLIACKAWRLVWLDAAGWFDKATRWTSRMIRWGLPLHAAEKGEIHLFGSWNNPLTITSPHLPACGWGVESFESHLAGERNGWSMIVWPLSLWFVGGSSADVVASSKQIAKWCSNPFLLRDLQDQDS